MYGRRLLATLLFVLIIPGLETMAGAPAERGRKSSASATPSFQFLSAKAAKTAIIDDVSDPFFSRLQSIDMSALIGSQITGDTLPDQRAELVRRIQAAVRGFTADEKKMLRWLVNQAHPTMHKHYPAVARLPWSFIKLADEVMGGQPHTRGRHIVLGEGMLAGLVLGWKTDPNLILRAVDRLLPHEQFHVFQREHRALMLGLYTKEWKFIRAENIDGGQWIIENHATNPDGPDTGWVFPIHEREKTRWIWPQIVYRERDGRRRMPADLRMVAIDVEPTDSSFRALLDSHGKPVMQDLALVKAYTKRFVQSPNNYHPDEISAEWFAEVVVADSQLDANKRKKGGAETAAFRKWCRANLK